MISWREIGAQTRALGLALAVHVLMAALVLLQKAGVSKVGLMSDPAELGYGGDDGGQ